MSRLRAASVALAALTGAAALAATTAPGAAASTTACPSGETPAPGSVITGGMEVAPPDLQGNTVRGKDTCD